MAYDFKTIEPKWQKKWEEKSCFVASESDDKPKFYCLEMFPYPSGALHMGHLRNYSLGDMTARYLRMNGYNVLYPMGFDSFGMPAENAAIKMKTHPAEWTWKNIAHMTDQLKSMGCSYDWSRTLESCDDDYYRWSQWFFLQFYKRGLAYRKNAPVNWCENCQTVLANEQVVGDDVCWRCGTPVVKRELDQWFFRITDYAEELLEGLDSLPGWPERVLTMQKNWIGKSEGVRFEIKVAEADLSIEAFTTRIDTVYGISFVAIAAEHPLVAEIIEKSSAEKASEIENFVHQLSHKSAFDRAGSKDKLGVDTGFHAINPVNGQQIPIWIADYILMDYGTGAIMGVPAHDQRDFEFARKYALPIMPVIHPSSESIPNGDEMESATVSDGIMCNSGQFNGQLASEAIINIAEWFETEGWGKREKQYRLRDWLISRQRYWGTPIPVVYCDDCGILPVPEEQLPVLLPMDAQIPEHGGNALHGCPDWIATTCPKCGKKARRETDTMDTFICSSWYFLRYLSATDDTRPFDPEEARRWMPVDLYIGGIEHACLHLIYARFFTKVLRDMGLLPSNVGEPFAGLLTQGMVLKDGVKMSKSLGNVVDPDEIIKKYGADTARLFILFAAPAEKALDWSDQGVEGAYRFLSRVWRIVEDNIDGIRNAPKERLNVDSLQRESLRDFKRLIHSTIERVTRDIYHERQSNTAVARLMELCNGLVALKPVSKEDWALFREGVESLLLCLSPIAPHMCEELWEMLGHETFLAVSSWPSVDHAALVQNNVTVVLQINGKVREQYEAPAKLTKEELQEFVLTQPKSQARLEGQEIIKIIAVPDKLVNVVVKG